MLNYDNIKDFSLDIKDGCFYWQVILNDNIRYQIMYRMKKHITPKGNISKIKEYFIRKNGQELIFDDKTKKYFKAFIMPYIRSGI